MGQDKPVVWAPIISTKLSIPKLSGTQTVSFLLGLFVNTVDVAPLASTPKSAGALQLRNKPDEMSESMKRNCSNTRQCNSVPLNEGRRESDTIERLGCSRKTLFSSCRRQRCNTNAQFPQAAPHEQRCEEGTRPISARISRSLTAWCNASPTTAVRGSTTRFQKHRFLAMDLRRTMSDLLALWPRNICQISVLF